ncbi:MAG: winged helix-turn-helix domain-containing protein [Eubacteriales bacterium]|nr:winged helix-turn-helix domain-containing protein [Eubacteriales bacterium]
METKYFEIVRYFEELEAQGKLQAGDKLPGERKIGRQFQVARGTVQAAYAEMLRRNWIVQVHGSGTYWKHLPCPAAQNWEKEAKRHYQFLRFLCFSDEEIMDLAQKEAKR